MTAAHIPRQRELALLWADLIMLGRPLAVELLTGHRHGRDGGAGLGGPLRPYARYATGDDEF